MVSKVILIVLAIAAVAHGTFAPCESLQEPLAIEVENCSKDAEYCEVKRGAAFNVAMTFQSGAEQTVMKAGVRAQVAGVWISWPMGNRSKVCEHLTQGSCPLAPNTKATFSFSFPIPSLAPAGTSTVVELKVKGQDGNPVACTRFPVLVTA